MHRDDVLRLADEVFIEPRPLTPIETAGLMEFIREAMNNREDRVADLEQQVDDLEATNEGLTKTIGLRIGGELVYLERVNCRGDQEWKVSKKSDGISGDSVNLSFHGWDIKLEIYSEGVR